MPSGINKLVLKTFTTISLGLCSSFALSADKPSSAISAEKQEELNKLIAEAVKQAGIELDEEELTIVIVKKPGDDADSDNEEGQIIGEITTKGSAEENSSNNESPSSSTQEQVAQATDKKVAEESSDIETVAKKSVERTDTPTKAQADPIDNTTDSAPKLAEKTPEDSEEKDKAVAIIPAAAPAASQQNANNIAAETNTAATTTQSVSTAQPLEDTVYTASKTAKAKQELATSPNKPLKANEPVAETAPTLKTVTEEELAKESITAKPIEIEETAVLQQQEIEKLQQTTVPAIKASNTQQPNINNIKGDQYYGNYIPPERQIDSYYSSDIMEAINNTGNGSQELAIPHDQVAKLSLPAMETNEMSDLVVEGALDATAAGGVSTTTLKTAVVVPDDTVLEDFDKELEDEDIEEIKEALNKKDLNQRVREALDQLARNQNRGASSANSIGNMSASGVNVTATVSSRATENAITNFRQTNLNNTNF